MRLQCIISAAADLFIQFLNRSTNSWVCETQRQLSRYLVIIEQMWIYWNFLTLFACMFELCKCIIWEFMSYDVWLITTLCTCVFMGTVRPKLIFVNVSAWICELICANKSQNRCVIVWYRPTCVQSVNVCSITESLNNIWIVMVAMKVTAHLSRDKVVLQNSNSFPSCIVRQRVALPSWRLTHLFLTMKKLMKKWNNSLIVLELSQWLFCNIIIQGWPNTSKFWIPFRL